MFTKQDDQFAEIALDPERRRAAIADLSRQRTLFFWLAMFMFALGLLENEVGKQFTRPVGTSFLCLFVVWICGKKESELRLLKVIERREKANDSAVESRAWGESVG
ncbi:MAG: hypothetical protein FJ302_14485 [Planctomycetes bacterium]|nr:hypothetical protein [Planctomycetota bacterium]